MLVGFPLADGSCMFLLLLSMDEGLHRGYLKGACENPPDVSMAATDVENT